MKSDTHGKTNQWKAVCVVSILYLWRFSKYFSSGDLEDVSVVFSMNCLFDTPDISMTEQYWDEKPSDVMCCSNWHFISPSCFEGLHYNVHLAFCYGHLLPALNHMIGPEVHTSCCNICILLGKPEGLCAMLTHCPFSSIQITQWDDF